jgi:hypothetical protein
VTVPRPQDATIRCRVDERARLARRLLRAAPRQRVHPDRGEGDGPSRLVGVGMIARARVLDSVTHTWTCLDMLGFCWTRHTSPFLHRSFSLSVFLAR